jgi:uncharacterized protein
VPLGGLFHGLIDTGAIVAIVESDDEWHEPCMEALRVLRLPLLTTEAVLTETFHLIGNNSRKIDLAWNFIRSGGVMLRPTNDSDLPHLRALMERYADRPMDFADASLVHLATQESLSVVLTVDHDDFETYRLGKGKRFTVLPKRLRTT